MSANPNAVVDPSKGLEMEFNTLRTEVLKRIELRQQLVSITLTLAGAFLAVGLGNSAVALVYPPLAMFLAAGWTQNELRIRQIGQYIRVHIEGALPGLGWEKYRREKELETRVGAWPLVIASSSGIFLVTQILAIGIGLYKFTFTYIEYILLVIDAFAVLLSLLLSEHARRRARL